MISQSGLWFQYHTDVQQYLSWYSDPDYDIRISVINYAIWPVLLWLEPVVETVRRSKLGWSVAFPIEFRSGQQKIQLGPKQQCQIQLWRWESLFGSGILHNHFDRLNYWLILPLPSKLRIEWAEATKNSSMIAKTTIKRMYGRRRISTKNGDANERGEVSPIDIWEWFFISKRRLD